MGGLYKCFAKDGTLVRSRTDGPDGQVGQRRPNTPHSTFFLVKSSQLTKNGAKANRSGPDARRPRSKGHHLLQQVRNRTDGPDGQVGQRRPSTTHSTFFLVKSSQLTKNGAKANRSGPDARRPRSKGHHLLQQVRNRTDGPDGQVGQSRPQKSLPSSCRGSTVLVKSFLPSHLCFFVRPSILMLASLFRLDWTHFARGMIKSNDVPLEAF